MSFNVTPLPIQPPPTSGGTPHHRGGGGRQHGGPRPQPFSPPPNSPAFEILRHYLDGFQLGGLAEWAWKRHKELGGGDLAMQAIQTEITQQQAFRDRFPAYEALAKQGHAWSPAQIMQYEQTVRDQLSAIGADRHYSNQDIQQFAIDGKSATEIGDRVQMAIQASSAPNAVTDELRRIYGIHGSMLAQFWLDPDRTMARIQQMWNAGQIAGQATDTGWGQLTKGEAERLAKHVSADQAQQAFSDMVMNQELYNPLLGEQGLSRNTQLQAVAGNPNALRRIQQKQRERVAQFSGSAGWGQSQTGTVGLGDQSQ